MGSHEKWWDLEALYDYQQIVGKKDRIVGGYLAVSKGEVAGFKEGGNSLVGLSFTRYMLRKFWHDRSSSLCEYKDIFERAIRSFSPSKQINCEQEDLPRIFLDANSRGWKGHLVVRMIGNVGSTYNKEGPFFEIMINSALNFENYQCYPFDTVILENSNVAEYRKKRLDGLKRCDENIGFDVTYFDDLISPQKFIDNYKLQNGKQPGPNSMRLLEGLKLLNNLEMKAQTVGNCWIKQAKRSVLVTLFIETLTLRPELSPKKALSVSKTLYKKWTAFNRTEIKKWINEDAFPRDLAAVALAKIKKKEK